MNPDVDKVADKRERLVAKVGGLLGKDLDLVWGAPRQD